MCCTSSLTSRFKREFATKSHAAAFGTALRRFCMRPVYYGHAQRRLRDFNLQVLGMRSLKPYVPDFSTAFQHFCIHPGGKAVIQEVRCLPGLAPLALLWLCQLSTSALGQSPVLRTCQACVRPLAQSVEAISSIMDMRGLVLLPCMIHCCTGHTDISSDLACML